MTKRKSVELSKNLLQMKFMQRTKENAERNNRNIDEQIVGHEILDLCKKESDRFLTTNSFIFCENLKYGRMSFKNMNPEIERLMQSKIEKKIVDVDKQEDEEEPADVSDLEMAKAFKKRKTNRF